MGGDHLCVEEGEAEAAEVACECDEADVAGVGSVEGVAGAVREAGLGEVEHGFAEEGGAEGQAIEAAEEMGLAGGGVGGPGFDGVGVSGVMQEVEPAGDGGVDPGAFVGVGVVVRFARLGAVIDDLGEGGVRAEVEGTGADAAIESARDMEAEFGGEGEYAAGIGAGPVDVRGAEGFPRGSRLGHGEVAAAVGVEE